MKTIRHDIDEILLKLVLNTNQSINLKTFIVHRRPTVTISDLAACKVGAKHQSINQQRTV
jgi:hypothetical protein